MCGFAQNILKLLPVSILRNFVMSVFTVAD